MNLLSFPLRISLIIATVFSAYFLLTTPAYASSDCKSDPHWFSQSGTPKPNNNESFGDDNCKFHQWSWQTFLWLTQEVDGKPRFLSMKSPDSLSGMSAEGLMPRMQKSNAAESFNEYLQAGSDGIMIDQQGRAVYYSQYINDDFVKFIKDKNLNNPKVVQALGASTATISFPVGTIELKVSWKVVQKNEDTSDMFTMLGKVAKLVNKNGKIVIAPDETETVQLALVGFHIAGVVKDHPEMIWATFEHKKNAPNVPEKVKPNTVISNSDWTFYKAKTEYKDCNVNHANTLNLDESSQILSSVTQVCRQYEFGNDPSTSDVQTNDNNIASLNADVLKHLDKIDVWGNYFEVGAIWFKMIDGLKPNMSLATDKILTGSLKLSNSTIETYTQVQSAKDNCFRCHNTSASYPSSSKLSPLPGLNLNISHAFQNLYFWSQKTKEAE